MKHVFDFRRFRRYRARKFTDETGQKAIAGTATRDGLITGIVEALGGKLAETEKVRSRGGKGRKAERELAEATAERRGKKETSSNREQPGSKYLSATRRIPTCRLSFTGATL